MNNAFINGFTKRAQEHGLTNYEAEDLCKEAFFNEMGYYATALPRATFAGAKQMFSNKVSPWEFMKHPFANNPLTKSTQEFTRGYNDPNQQVSHTMSAPFRAAGAGIGQAFRNASSPIEFMKHPFENNPLTAGARELFKGYEPTRLAAPDSATVAPQNIRPSQNINPAGTGRSFWE